jgi:hypothetical protein
MVKSQLKFYLGMALFVLYIIMPLFGFWVAATDWPVGIKSAAIAFLSIGGPELVAILAILVLGREVFDKLKTQLFAALRGATRVVQAVHSPQ